MRFHGRDSETWDIKDSTAASDRFNYDYSDDELATFVPYFRNLAREVELVQGILNNNYEDEGQRNAQTLIGMIGDLF